MASENELTLQRCVIYIYEIRLADLFATKSTLDFIIKSIT
jgi:hypothetical protein